MQNKEKEIKGRWEGQGQKYKKIQFKINNCWVFGYFKENISVHFTEPQVLNV